MPKNTSEDARRLVVQLFVGGKIPKKRIARETNLSLYRVKNAIKKFENNADSTNSLKNARKTGRPPKLDARGERRLLRLMQADRRKSAATLRDEMAIGGYFLGVSTIKRILKKHGFVGRVAVRKPFISKINKKKRQTFAEQHLHWTFDDWSKVLFTDESKFDFFAQKSRIIVRRRPGEKYILKCIVGTVKHGGGSVLVWGGFGAAGVGDLVIIPSTPKFTATAYIDLLNDHLSSSLEKAIPFPNEDWYLLQDNDPKHKAKVTLKYFVDEGIPLIDWPPQSPDLNPIESLWRIIKEILIKEGFRARSRIELIQKLNEVWNSILAVKIQELINSMPQRMIDVKNSKGGPTRY
jgi:transposase